MHHELQRAGHTDPRQIIYGPEGRSYWPVEDKLLHWRGTSGITTMSKTAQLTIIAFGSSSPPNAVYSGFEQKQRASGSAGDEPFANCLMGLTV